ncbi:uncharacterized protein LOC111917929 [Lactuca sativa]|uniref:uncharacterized protein LOC111917929 n=1 Tax=Lactuca sativa TaxID=4236 RepID=UPI000CD97913|nr:uncharacterized protein LOC111917929 [Lactuca sativa]
MQQGSSSSGSGMSLENIVKSIATSTQVFQNETEASIKTLEQQMTKLATSVSKLESQGKLPAQTEKNPKHNACVITLRNSKDYEGPKMIEEEDMELEKEDKKSKVPSNQVPIEVKIIQPPFPTRLNKSKREREDNEIMEMFRKVEYYRKDYPQKCKDPSVFMVPCNILKKTGVIIQLADRSLGHPKGVLEDELVQVNELVFLADFYVLVVDDDDSPNFSSILQGLPFLKTARTKIKFYDGTLSMEFDGDVINFNIYDAMRYPSDISSLNFVDIGIFKDGVEKISKQFKIDVVIMEVVSCMDQKKKMRFDVPKLKLSMPNEKLVLLVVQAPELEIKTLPEHLKYVYLGDKESLLMIISTKLTTKE